MTIYSWNMLYRNKRLDEAFDFIRSADFDVFCLQEVPEMMLERLRTLPYELSFRQDVEKLFDDSTVVMYNVILSRHPIRKSAEVPFPDYRDPEPVRTRLFRRVMPEHFPALRNRGGVIVDIEANATSFRIIDLHLILAAAPPRRLEEFERAMLERDPALPTIVCGDFNTLEKPHITVLNWLFGGSLSHAAFYKRERMLIEKRFVEHGLFNPLRGSRTHGLSRSQLDHILVSRELAVERAEVLPDRHGSDHHPIRAVVTLPSSNNDTK